MSWLNKQHRKSIISSIIMFIIGGLFGNGFGPEISGSFSADVKSPTINKINSTNTLNP